MNKVVPFERDARFLRDRARRGRREGRLLDALALFRRAAEREPENHAYIIDVAETLCAMGCFAQSNRVLAGMLSRPGAPNDCYLGMCCNFFGKNDFDKAYRALIRFLAGDPNAVKREEVQQIIHDLVMARTLHEVKGRKNMRASQLISRAQAHIAGDTPRVAVALSRRAVGFGVKRRAANTVFAASLLAAGQVQGAVRAIDRALKHKKADIQTLLVATCVYMQSGDTQKALAALKRMPLEDKTLPYDLYRMMLDAAATCLDDARVRTMLPKALRQSPYSVRLLHMCAVNRVREGRPAEHAMSFWTRILLIDPNDVVARYHLKLAESGALEKELSYEYALPEKTRNENDRAIKRVLSLSDAQLSEQFETSDALIDLCRCLLFSGTGQSATLARAVLSRIDHPGARKLLCEGSIFIDMPAPASLIKGANGMGSVDIMDLNGKTGNVHMPPFFRKCVKIAIAAAHPEHEIAGQVVRLMIDCLAVHCAYGLSRDLGAWAAALLYGARKEIAQEIPLEEAAECMGAGLRKTRRCACLLGVMPRAMDKRAGGQNETD